MGRSPKKKQYPKFTPRRSVRFTSFLADDPHIRAIADRVSESGEAVTATKLVKLGKERYYFIATYHGRSYALRLAYLGFSLVFLGYIMWTLLFLPSWLIIVVLVIWTYLASRIWFKSPQIWRNCTGFVALDRKKRPIHDRSKYTRLFRAFALIEESCFRPVVVQRLPNIILKRRIVMLDELTQLTKGFRFPEPRTKLDREIVKIHKKLVVSEEAMLPLLARNQELTTSIHNLNLEMSEDCVIKLKRFTGLMKRLERNLERLVEMLESRALVYDQWLETIEKKYHVKIRVSRLRLMLSVMRYSISSAITSTPKPFLFLTWDCTKYLADMWAGVRGLRRSARAAKGLGRSIRAFRRLLHEDINFEHIRPLS